MTVSYENAILLDNDRKSATVRFVCLSSSRNVRRLKMYSMPPESLAEGRAFGRSPLVYSYWSAWLSRSSIGRFLCTEGGLRCR